jgi:hypothetical protein
VRFPQGKNASILMLCDKGISPATMTSRTPRKDRSASPLSALPKRTINFLTWQVPQIQYTAANAGRFESLAFVELRDERNNESFVYTFRLSRYILSIASNLFSVCRLPRTFCSRKLQHASKISLYESYVQLQPPRSGQNRSICMPAPSGCHRLVAKNRIMDWVGVFH